MAASPQASQKKRGRDVWNGGLPLPDAKRANSARLLHDSDLTALLEMIDNMDGISSNPEETHAVIQLKEERLNGCIKSQEDELGLKGQADEFEFVGVDGKGGTEMGSFKQSEITDWNHEVASICGTEDMHTEGNLTYYDDVRADLGFFEEHIAVDFGIIMNLLDGDSMANMYFDAVYGSTETVYGSLWEDDIWQLNENTVIQNEFESRQQEDFGISGNEFHDV